MNIFKRFYAWIILTLKNPVVKTAIHKIHDEFLASDFGKTIIQQAKERILKGEAQAEILATVIEHMKEKIESIVQDPKLRDLIFDYLKDKLIAAMKK